MNKSIRNFQADIYPYIKEKLSEFRKNGVVLWGKGSSALAFLQFLRDFDAADAVKGFCDSYTKEGSHELIANKKVYSPYEAQLKYPNATFVIASIFSHNIVDYIKKDSRLRNIKIFSFSKDKNKAEYVAFIYSCLYLRYVLGQHDSCVCNYLKFFDYFEDLRESNRYESLKKLAISMLHDDLSKKIISNKMDFFSYGNLDYLNSIPIEFSGGPYFNFYESHLSSEEVFFDCGAFTGDSVGNFIRAVKNKYKKILAFEPDEKNYKKLVETANRNKWNNIKCIKAATGNKHIYTCFSETGSLGAKLSDISEKSKQVLQVCLDEYIDDCPTLIKMDIEGAELACLMGAEQIIKKLKPKIAICLYHKPQDLFEIPIYLKQLVPEYRLIVKQHYHPLFDTVLYAM